MCLSYDWDLDASFVWSKKRRMWMELEPKSPLAKKIRAEHRGTAFPGSQGVIAVSTNRPGTAGELIDAIWGLQPSWTNEPNWGRKNAYCARAETLAVKPTWRDAFRFRRCIVPAASFTTAPTADGSE